MLPLYDRKQSKRETHWQRPGEFDVFTNCNVVSTCHVWYVTQYGHVSSVIVGEDSAIFGSELPGNDDDDGEDGDDERDQEGGAVFNSSSWLPGRDSK